MSAEVVDEVAVDPDRARVYAEGWQSWSPATWYRPGARALAPDEPWQHTMRFRPGVPVGPAPQGEGLLVVDTGDGARCYGAADATGTVPTLTATLDGGTIRVAADEPVERTDAPTGEAALAAFGDRFGARAGVRMRPAPTVWCSWYRYFERVTAADVLENLAAMDRHALPVDVVQIDDGWSTGLGEGLEPTAGFPDLPGLLARIRDSGRRAGLWLAPFLVGARTRLAREHPEWLTGEAGRNWGQDLVGLDLTHPAVRDVLRRHVERIRDLGVDYLKLDFLYAGALPGPRASGASPVEAYRGGLELIREAAGPNTLLLGCGAPILPSVGLVDAMRVSPDTFHEGAEDGSRGLRGLMPLAARTWQQGRFWSVDPDCLVARPAYALRERWADAVRRYGGLRSVSDRIAELDGWGLDATRALLEDVPPPAPLPDAVVAAGAREAASLVGTPLDRPPEEPEHTAPAGGRATAGAGRAAR